MDGKRPPKVHVPYKYKKRVVIYGVHLDDPAPIEERKVFKFWASVKLMQQYPLEGDIVNVRTRYGKKQIIVTDLCNYELHTEEPQRIATDLYEGDKYQDIEIDVEKIQGKRA